MNIFISYRSSRDSTDRALRQFLDYVQAAVDTPSRYRHPLSKSKNLFSGISDAVLDLEISRASSRAVTLVALIGGRDDRDSDRFISSQVSKQIGLLTSRWLGRNQYPPWRAFGQTSITHRYRNFLSIGIGSAFRASVAIKRLILLQAPNGIASTDQTRNRRRAALSSDISNQLFLEELGRAQGRDRTAIVSSRIAGLAVVTDDRSSERTWKRRRHLRPHLAFALRAHNLDHSPCAGRADLILGGPRESIFANASGQRRRAECQHSFRYLHRVAQFAFPCLAGGYRRSRKGVGAFAPEPVSAGQDIFRYQQDAS